LLLQGRRRRHVTSIEAAPPRRQLLVGLGQARRVLAVEPAPLLLERPQRLRPSGFGLRETRPVRLLERRPSRRQRRLGRLLVRDQTGGAGGELLLERTSPLLQRRE
jgi:hypothetical protein